MSVEEDNKDKSLENMDNKKNLTYSRQTNTSSRISDVTTSKLNNVVSKRESFQNRQQQNFEGNKRNNNLSRFSGRFVDNKQRQQKGFLNNQKEEFNQKQKKLTNETANEEASDIGSTNAESCAHDGAHTGDNFSGRKSESAKNLNHMINFHYEDSHRKSYKQNYNGYYENHQYGSSKKNSNSKSQSYKKKGFFSKERFLQANCQFVVKDDGEYGVHAVDPDALAQWDFIQQVKLTVHEAPYCPICLYPPKAAKITRCGHIYCWPCILHYLSLDDKSWRKCPICCDAVHPNDLKSVQATMVTKYEAGMQITMMLMKKTRRELTVMPRTQWSRDVGHLRSVRDLMQSSYAKLLTSDYDYVSEMMSKEREELIELLDDEEDNSLESCFIKLALEKLDKQRTEWINSSGSSPTSPSLCPDKSCHDGAFNGQQPKNESSLKVKKIEDATALSTKFEATSGAAASMKFYLSAFDDEEAIGCDCDQMNKMDDTCDNDEDDDEDDSDNIEAGSKGNNEDEVVECNERVEVGCMLKDGRDIQVSGMMDTHDNKDDILKQCANQKNIKMNDEERNVLYFYQAADGQHIYMHPLNVKSLKHEYHTLSQCPNEIVANILEVEERSMDELLRDRLRYLNHLPLSCEFKLVELDLGLPILSQETMDMFDGMRRSREADRKRRMKRDTKMAARIQREENKKLGIDPTMQIIKSDYNTNKEFVSCEPRMSKISETSTSSHDCQNNSIAGGVHDDDDDVCVVNDVVTTTGWNNSMSFAQMIRMGKTRPQQAIGAIKKQPDLSSSLKNKSQKHNDGDDDDGDEVSLVPDFKLQWCEGITEKLKSMEVSNKERVDRGVELLDYPSGQEVSNNKNKKKKSKHMLLFTTRGVGPRC